MKLLAILEERGVDRSTHLYIDEKTNKICGFSIVGDELVPLSDRIAECFDAFSLGNNVTSVGDYQEYEVMLDNDTGLKHYFKDGKEDFFLLYSMNGVHADLIDSAYRSYKGHKGIDRFRKFVINNKTIAFLLILDIALIAKLVSFIDPVAIWRDEYVDLKAGISYVLDLDEKNKFDYEVELTIVKDYIYEKSNIENERVKDYIFNPHLLLNVFPCYEGNPMAVVTRVRHLGLKIVPYTEEEERELDTSGYCGYDGVLHVRGFDEDNFDKDSSIAKTLAHEYVHLLQTTTGYSFVREVTAELAAHEFFGFSTLSTDGYSYSKACKYARVLMELIGSTPVWDNAFRQNSTALDDSVRPYLSEDEYRDFVRVMNCSPYYQKEELEELYPRFEEILENLSLRKNGYSMHEDEMIEAILNGAVYSRAYFKSTLMTPANSYFEVQAIDYEEAMKEGLLTVLKRTGITYEQYLDENYFPNFDKRMYLVPAVEYKDFNLLIENNDYSGTLTLNNGTTMSVEEAIEKGFVKRVCTTNSELIRVDLEEYLQNPSNIDYVFFPCLGCTLDTENRKVNLTTPIKKYVEPFNEKFKMEDMTM